MQNDFEYRKFCFMKLWYILCVFVCLLVLHPLLFSQRTRTCSSECKIDQADFADVPTTI